mmetsp:Transcript_17031/g.32060  ORF Transcript_17031/g.32060 Transcript_17031/m.32060 type:complete len:439 (+) Transcript_17031:108-1424(+)
MSSVSVRKGVVAEQHILDQHGVESFESVHPETGLSTSGITHRGWTFCTTHGKIANEAEGLELSQTIARRADAVSRDDDVILMRSHTGAENHLHTPPMLFPHDSLVLAHNPAAGREGQDTQTRVEFNVLDALSCWAVQHRAPELAAFIPEVPYAHKWQPPTQDSTQASGVKSQDKTVHSSEELPTDVAMQYQEWDWTYSTPYSCTTRLCEPAAPLHPTPPARLSCITSGGVPLSHSDPCAVLSSPDRQRLWQPCQPGGINMEMLRKKDQPILFFDEVLLYQDDLEDCGESAFDVKVRVMPACWFVLARLYSRVDGGRLVMRETRLFHEFGQDRVVMELTWRQCQESHFRLQQPKDLGGPPGSLPPTMQRPQPPSLASASSGVGITSSQLRDANIMSTLIPSLTPLAAFESGDDSNQGAIGLDFGAVQRPERKDYSLSLS